MTAKTKRSVTLFHGLKRYLDGYPKPEQDQHRDPRPLKTTPPTRIVIAKDLYEYLELESWKTQNSLPGIPGTKIPKTGIFPKLVVKQVTRLELETGNPNFISK